MQKLNTIEHPAKLIDFILDAKIIAVRDGKLIGKNTCWAPDFFDIAENQMKTILVAANNEAKVSAMGLNKAITKAITAYDINLRNADVGDDDRKRRVARMKQSMLKLKAVPDFHDGDVEIRGKEGLDDWFSRIEGKLIPVKDMDKF